MPHPHVGVSPLRSPLLWMTVIAMLSLQVWYIARGWREVGIGNLDFAALYATASSAHRGGALNYDPSKISLADGHSDPAPSATEPAVNMDMLHPPFEVLLFLPLTFAPYRTACVLWTICNLAFLWAIPFVLWRLLPRIHPDFYLLMVALGMMRPVQFCLVYGQDSILLLLLFCLALRSLLTNHAARGGFFLALGLFKFHLVLPIVAALIVVKNWRAVLGFLTGLLALVLAAFAFLGTRTTLRYSAFLFQYSRHIAIAGQGKTQLMPNLRGLVATTLGTWVPPATQTLMVAAISIALLALLLLWIARFPDLPMPLLFAASLAVTSLISFHYFPHNSVILLLPLLLMANYVAGPSVHRTLRWIFLATLLIVSLATFGFLPVETGMPLLACASVVLMALIFAVPFMRPAPGQALLDDIEMPTGSPLVKP